MPQAAKTSSVIENLIETLRDGEEGFKQAAKAVRNAQFRTTFADYSEQRAHFARELQIASATGMNEPTTMTNASHRAGMGLTSAIIRRDEHAIFAECEREEDFAVETYKEAMQNNALRPALRDIVSRQYRDIQAAHDQIKLYREVIG
jgi:uncharacterized protein (TIGR02284 family)